MKVSRRETHRRPASITADTTLSGAFLDTRVLPTGCRTSSWPTTPGSRSPNREFGAGSRNGDIGQEPPCQLCLTDRDVHLRDSDGIASGKDVRPCRTVKPHPSLYKVIFTHAVFDGEGPPPGVGPLWSAVNKVPLAEVHLDLSTRKVVATFPPPAKPFYGNVQVPIF